MTKPHEENWVAVKTQQGAWVRGVDGEAIAMVYNPMANVVSGDTMKERMDAADALAFARAQEMAAAPDMARALDTLVTFLSEDVHWTNPANADEYAALYEAREALRKAKGET